MFLFSERELKKALHDTLTRAALSEFLSTTEISQSDCEISSGLCKNLFRNIGEARLKTLMSCERPPRYCILMVLMPNSSANQIVCNRLSYYSL